LAKGRNREVRKMIRGIDHKLCTGPLHREGEFIKVDDFYRRGNGKVRPQCKACEAYYLNSEPLVSMASMQFAIRECIFRIGKAETARRLGIATKTVSGWISKSPSRPKYIKRRNARALISLLTELRSTNEARHRASIKHGASARGRTERIPKRTKDFNGANDFENERKRKSRADARLTRAV
jgi:transposase-like protein